VDSVPGEGATFRVRLPLAPEIDEGYAETELLGRQSGVDAG
jgi:hypothetical protein